jgi:hypothetical protein
VLVFKGWVLEVLALETQALVQKEGLVREVVECLEMLLFLVLLVLAGLAVAVEGQQRQKTKA